jgi:hypothetical protein
VQHGLSLAGTSVRALRYRVLELVEVTDGTVAALAADPDRGRRNQRSVTSAQHAREYGFTDMDGSQPDVWGYEEAVDAGRNPAPDDRR